MSKNSKSIRTVGKPGKPVAERRLVVVKALRRIGAVSPLNSRTIEEISAKCGLTAFDTYGQLYHTHLLQTKGFVKQVKLEGTRRASFHLTARGAKAGDKEILGIEVTPNHASKKSPKPAAAAAAATI